MIIAAHSSWEDLHELARKGAAALVPVGSTEAHGPHLPLATDVIIACEVAARAQALLEEAGRPSVIFPPLAYGVTEFARGFAGTVSIAPSTMEALAVDIARSIHEQGFSPVVFVNHHLEPAHFEALHRAAEAAQPARVIVPDHRKKPWALELGEEFCRGGSHAGRYETSLVLAADPVRVAASRRDLPVLDIDLGKKIREGARSFGELGADRAYMGDPAAATAEEGNRLYQVLARQVAELVLAA
ncbi:MAG TPA: creatininase family protein [Fredinandcohnia sp.]|nr:creatininase family protein [Fredinandcohnia sp.]